MKFPTLFLFLFLSQIIIAQKVIPLYEGKPQGSENWTWSEQIKELENDRFVYNVAQPTLTAYLPPYYLATGTAVIIAPGGGYYFHSFDKEGTKVAEWLQSKGIAAFVLKYRLVHSQTNDPDKELTEKWTTNYETVLKEVAEIAPLAMEDGLTAIKYVRERAKELDIDPSKIGFMGFSAGGHLTMSVAYNGIEENRPNFIAPIYAWNPIARTKEVPKSPMPAFVAVAGDDPLNLMPHSIDIYKKWNAAGQPAELHVYQKGGHGFGMQPGNVPTDTWYERFGEWMHTQGYLKKLYPNKYEKLYGEDAIAKGKIEQVKQMQNDYAQLTRYQAANQALALPKPTENRVVFLGNSITEGWVGIDSAFFADHHFIGRGISGQTSPQLLLRFRQDVVDLKPKAVVIHIGTNDVAENTGPYHTEFTMSNIQSMVDIAQANRIKVILASVLPATKFEWRRALGDRSAMIVDLNKRIKKFAAKRGIPYVDYHTTMKNDENGMSVDIAEDGVHPTQKGFEIMKGLVLPVIKNVLKK